MNNIFIFDRSDLDEVVCIIPVGHKDNATATAIQVTRREDLERQRFIFRRDVVLWTGRSGRQYELSVNRNGQLVGDTFLLELLSDAQYCEVQGIAARMALNARDFEPAGKLLV